MSEFLLKLKIHLAVSLSLTRHLLHPRHTPPRTGKCHRWTSPSVHSPLNPHSLLGYTKTRQESISYQRFYKYFSGQDEPAIISRFSLSLTHAHIRKWMERRRSDIILILSLSQALALMRSSNPSLIFPQPRPSFHHDDF